MSDFCKQPGFWQSWLPIAELDDEERSRADRAVADGLLRVVDDAYVLADAGRLLADGVVRQILVD